MTNIFISLVSPTARRLIAYLIGTGVAVLNQKFNLGLDVGTIALVVFSSCVYIAQSAVRQGRILSFSELATIVKAAIEKALLDAKVVTLPEPPK